MLKQLFGSGTRARVIGWLFMHPDEAYYVRQLSEILEVDPTNLSKELDKLYQLGILSRKISGNQKHYSANQESPIYSELRNIVIKTSAVADRLGLLLKSIRDKIEIAFIYGSFASGSFSKSSDLDLLVVGDIDYLELVALVRKFSREIGREANISCFTGREFIEKLKEKGFIWRISQGKKLFVIGGDDELRNMGKESVD
ncbi:MAG: nucleotidyltransferase domain-containing protein [Sphaerochaetaceae bacterium]|nr:nucleotidyltransferase domain-containing protein [Sphaerochaetaceae bacterium]